jgi:hypothetical protein
MITDNLTYACMVCNRYKGSNIASVAPSGDLVPLFNPRFGATPRTGLACFNFSSTASMDQYHLSFRRLKAASAPLDSIMRFFRLTRKTRLGRLNEGARGEFSATTAPIVKISASMRNFVPTPGSRRLQDSRHSRPITTAPRNFLKGTLVEQVPRSHRPERSRAGKLSSAHCGRRRDERRY